MNEPGGRRAELDGSGHRGEEPAGFEEFFRHYAPVVRRYLLWREAETAVLDDTVQLTMMSAYRYWERVQYMDPPTGWLFKVAGQRLQDVRQSDQRQRMVQDAVRKAAPAACPDPMVVSDQRLDVLAAVRKLPPRQQEALALREQFGLRYKDIAEVMGVAPATVRAHIHQAHQTLRMLLGEGEQG
ncbi:RNA polymerase sigma factor [Actinacidiphila guanduensis]|uniref:RNA polymerase sigma-70 factor, ECF subfamily n=1 Tax=Actinacidiphila guanduensis TaxID=310781 RepID=A0A1G9W462_9ACTN|nr:sigma-70 family RNA polymerase sigma factor [Actinacidiphila guanduensis]SDM79280.1 RNA polymerase sigma-70 factor, ECF subfamily [Actinacidiphila guanduensis]